MKPNVSPAKGQGADYHPTSAFNAEVEREKQEAAFLDGVRKIVKQTLGQILALRSE